MCKRGENIYKRRDNRWEGRYSIILPDGTKKYISIYSKSYAEVKERLAVCREQALHNTANLPKCSLTVQTLLQNWLATKKDTIKLSSYLRYANLINN